MRFAAIGGTLPHNMIFAPYGSQLDIVLKTSFSNYFQKRVDELKKLNTTEIHAYIELLGVDVGRGPFLFLPRNIKMDKKLLDYIRQYFAEYKKDLVANKLFSGNKIQKSQINESFLTFKEEIKKVNQKLFTALNGEFKAFKRFLNLYFISPKLAWCFYRIRYFPLILTKEFHRTRKKFILLKDKYAKKFS